VPTYSVFFLILKLKTFSLQQYVKHNETKLALCHWPN